MDARVFPNRVPLFDEIRVRGSRQAFPELMYGKRVDSKYHCPSMMKKPCVFSRPTHPERKNLKVKVWGSGEDAL